MADSEASWAPWVLGLRSGRGREWRAEGRGLCCAAKGGEGRRCRERCGVSVAHVVSSSRAGAQRGERGVAGMTGLGAGVLIMEGHE